MQEQLNTVLILGVGQTLGPLEFALTEHTPQGVILVASQGSQAVAGELVRRYGDGLRYHTLLLDDPEDLGEVFRKGRLALQKALEWEARAIVADITGGTKTMSAGLVLALTGQGVTFSYVGGQQRDPQGRVKSGSERLRLLEDPTYRYGLREWEGFRRAWNQCDYQAAQEFLDELLARPLTPSEKRFYGHLKGITEGMLDWDLFYHKAAWQKLKAHLEPALAIAEAWGHRAKVRALQELQQAQERLRDILDREGKPTFALLADLLANAQRRASRGRYDDALARLYRAVELAAEADLFERTGIILHKESTYPDKLKALANSNNKTLGLKEALGLAFEIDTRLGNTGTLAQYLYGDYSSKLQGLLQQRHSSILAHGVKPVKPEAVQGLQDYLREKGLEAAPAWPTW
ncbi:TIGR02710 family CRISPR-associated CARF protein [Meiothermus taiwanensis]|uniref:CRISPR-associated protein, TIGR02710 family n=1 Tax=Meiothermus taiwanensis WR-220 TaxID=1339250 RepID=A0ABN5M3K5_9DEIN|nr:TIGR02710 family CRISPR-associated CARF protein [Meiothermus taiwanensis]AWR87844.1 CRISPR-associated protein, TIGR02710 family [Meiothermus taiwanensis WR-220]KIQ53769.1 CRISPR-associated protein [Meiothermus taiwanensis]KZK15442.1 CRISPR-associated protein [Meiothermus taiwanensis]